MTSVITRRDIAEIYDSLSERAIANKEYDKAEGYKKQASDVRGVMVLEKQQFDRTRDYQETKKARADYNHKLFKKSGK